MAGDLILFLAVTFIVLAMFQERRQSGPFGDDCGYSAPLTQESQINNADDEFGK
jgi:hypothetical protein